MKDEGIMAVASAVKLADNEQVQQKSKDDEGIRS